jgi:uncharacterized surface protein with fasciclin (FAS1) repeats
MRVAIACLALTAAFVAPATAADDEKTIVQVAASDKQFSTLVAAIKAAGLAEALQGDGPFTVFAPTNDAFKKLPAGTVETLLKPENKDKLTAILKSHVVSGKVMAADAMKLDGKSAKSLSGEMLPVKVDGGKVCVGKATVTKADIAASNGVIHVIDTVILPSEK